MKRIEMFYQEMRNVQFGIDLPNFYLVDIEYLNTKKTKYQKIIKICSKIIEQNFVVPISLENGNDGLGFSITPRPKMEKIEISLKPNYFPALKNYIAKIEITTFEALTHEEVKEKQFEKWDALPLLEKLKIAKELIKEELKTVEYKLKFWNEEI